MILTHVKFVWTVTRNYIRQYIRVIKWHFNSVKFWHGQIKEQFKRKPYNPDEIRGWGKLPFDPEHYPYDKKKAEDALSEVNKWIKEEEYKIHKQNQKKRK